jgi:ADP-ribosylglycohydrolase
MSSMSERIQSILSGLAAGDRNGGPVRMASRLAQSLVARKGFDAVDIGARYLAWWRDGAFDTGPVTAGVLALVDSGLSFAEAADRVDLATGGMTAGCNPAHRIAPLAALPDVDVRQLCQFAINEAGLTHKHPLAGDVSAAVVSLCHYLVHGCSWKDALARAADGRLPETRSALLPANSREIGRGGYAPETLAAALYFLDSSQSFQQALEKSLEFAGPANYCPVLVGSIGGARWGTDGIHMPA